MCDPDSGSGPPSVREVFISELGLGQLLVSPLTEAEHFRTVGSFFRSVSELVLFLVGWVEVGANAKLTSISTGMCVMTIAISPTAVRHVMVKKACPHHYSGLVVSAWLECGQFCPRCLGTTTTAQADAPARTPGRGYWN